LLTVVIALYFCIQISSIFLSQLAKCRPANAKKRQNRISDCESNGIFWIGKPNFLFNFSSNHSELVSAIFAYDRLTDNTDHYYSWRPHSGGRLLLQPEAHIWLVQSAIWQTVDSCCQEKSWSWTLVVHQAAVQCLAARHRQGTALSCRICAASAATKSMSKSTTINNDNDAAARSCMTSWALTCNTSKSLQRQVFLGNHLKWYRQIKSTNKITHAPARWSLMGSRWWVCVCQCGMAVTPTMGPWSTGAAPFCTMQEHYCLCVHMPEVYYIWHEEVWLVTDRMTDRQTDRHHNQIAYSVLRVYRRADAKNRISGISVRNSEFTDLVYAHDTALVVQSRTAAATYNAYPLPVKPHLL